MGFYTLIINIVNGLSHYTAWKGSKYRVFFGLYFSVFKVSTGKYRPEKTPCLDKFHTVLEVNKTVVKFEIDLGTLSDIITFKWCKP